MCVTLSTGTTMLMNRSMTNLLVQPRTTQVSCFNHPSILICHIADIYARKFYAHSKWGEEEEEQSSSQNVSNNFLHFDLV